MAYNDATNVDFWEGLSGAETPVMHTRGAAEHFRKLPPGVRMFDPMPLAGPCTASEGRIHPASTRQLERSPRAV